MESEEWRAVPGYEGRYEVSSHGDVRSLGFYSGSRGGTKTWRAGRVLKQKIRRPYGHRVVSLTDGSGAMAKDHKVHRLALRAFKGEPPLDKPNGLHEDDNPANNYIDNLYWGTTSENSFDCVRNGNHNQARKRRCKRLGHLLVPPNLVEIYTERGIRGCMACRYTQSARAYDERLRKQGRERKQAQHGREGFQRRFDESFEEEANRRYAHIMRNEPIR